jgi:hypothetical protein
LRVLDDERAYRIICTGPLQQLQVQFSLEGGRGEEKQSGQSELGNQLDGGG